MLKIWGRKNSSNVRKPLWAAEELGLAYEAIDAGGAFGVVDTPEYRAMNPNGRVPVIEDDGFVLWESNAIVRYLMARHAAGYGLVSGGSASPRLRRKMDGLDHLKFCRAVPHRVLGRVAHPGRPAGLGRPSRRRSRSATRCWRWPIRRWPNKPYLSGDEIGMGDIPLGSFIYAWFEMPIERAPQPHLQAWYERLKQRPAYQKAVMTALT